MTTSPLETISETWGREFIYIYKYWDLDNVSFIGHTLPDVFLSCRGVTTHSFHFIIGLQKSRSGLFNTLSTFYLYLYCVWHIVKHCWTREEACCLHYMGYSLQLAARYHLYASYRPTLDSTHHILCHPRYEALAGTRNSSVGPLGYFRVTMCQTSIYIYIHL